MGKGRGEGRIGWSLMEWGSRTKLRARTSTCRLGAPGCLPEGRMVTVSGVEGGARALAGLQVNYDEAQKEVTIVADVIDHQASVEVNAPLKFGK